MNALILPTNGILFALRGASGFSFSRGGWMCSGLSRNGVNGVLLEGARKRAPFDFFRTVWWIKKPSALNPLEISVALSLSVPYFPLLSALTLLAHTH
jgi:hypothetical protein